MKLIYRHFISSHWYVVCGDVSLHHCCLHHNHLLWSSTNNDGNCYSLPTPLPSRNDHPAPVLRSLSTTCPISHQTANSIYSTSSPCGMKHGNWVTMHQCTCSTLSSSSYAHLKHSNSVPTIGSNGPRRRLSLQSMNSYRSDSGTLVGLGQTERRFRRSSSAVYAVKGMLCECISCWAYIVTWMFPMCIYYTYTLLTYECH